MKTTGYTVAQNSAITLGASVAGYGLTFIASVIVARALGPEGKGVLQLVVLSHTLALTIANLGFSSANSYFIARGRYSFRSVARHSAWLAAALGMVAFAATALLSMILPATVVSPHERPYLLLAGALVPFALLTQFFTGALQGAGQILRLNVLTFAQTALYIAGVTVFLLVLRLGVPGALAAFGLATAGTALIALIVAGRAARESPGQDGSSERRGWNPELVRDTSRYGAKAYLSNVVSFLNLRSDQFLLGLIAGSGAVGQYSIAVTVAELMLFFPRALSTALLPRITGASFNDAGHMAASATRHTLGATLVGLVAIVPLALLIPVIFGANYAPAVIPCLIIAPGIGAYSLAPVLSTYFSGQLGKPLVPSLLAGLSLVVDLLLVWILAPRLGVSGAALASLIAYCVTVIIMVGLFHRSSGTPLREMVAFQRADFDAYHSLALAALGRLRRRS